MTECPWQRSIDCEDIQGRPRTVGVTITDEGQVAISAPAPGTGVLDHSALDLLKAALDSAQREAAIRRGRQQR